MGAMLTSLKGSALWVAALIVIAVLAAVTVLAYHGTLSGDLWVAIVTPIITGVTGVASAHVAGTQIGAALQTPPPTTNPPVAQLAQSAGVAGPPEKPI